MVLCICTNKDKHNGLPMRNSALEIKMNKNKLNLAIKLNPMPNLVSRILFTGFPSKRILY